MNIQPPRRVATPVASPLKRKEREHFRSFKPPPPRLGSAKSSLPTSKQPRTALDSAPSSKPTTPPQVTKAEGCNLLLAGYMAHEFLTKGYIMGEPFDPVRATAVPIGASKRSSRSIKPSHEAEERYAEISSLLKTDGAHIPGIFYPAQLASYLNL